jgi:hypothetical protein
VKRVFTQIDDLHADQTSLACKQILGSKPIYTVCLYSQTLGDRTGSLGMCSVRTPIRAFALSWLEWTRFDLPEIVFLYWFELALTDRTLPRNLRLINDGLFGNLDKLQWTQGNV